MEVSDLKTHLEIVEFSASTKAVILSNCRKYLTQYRSCYDASTHKLSIFVAQNCWIIMIEINWLFKSVFRGCTNSIAANPDCPKLSTEILGLSTGMLFSIFDLILVMGRKPESKFISQSYIDHCIPIKNIINSTIILQIFINLLKSIIF